MGVYGLLWDEQKHLSFEITIVGGRCGDASFGTCLGVSIYQLLKHGNASGPWLKFLKVYTAQKPNAIHS